MYQQMPAQGAYPTPYHASVGIPAGGMRPVDMSKYPCHNCGKVGHWARDCQELHSEQAVKERREQQLRERVCARCGVKGHHPDHCTAKISVCSFCLTKHAEGPHKCLFMSTERRVMVDVLQTLERMTKLAQQSFKIAEQRDCESEEEL